MTLLTEIRSRLHRFAKNEHGGPMVEIAIILPVLLILFAGATEVGRLFYTYTTLAKATKVGARFLSSQANIDVSTTACGAAGSACAKAKNLVICGNAGGCGGDGQPRAIVRNLTAANISITPPATGPNPQVTVSITGYTYQPLVFDFSGLTGTRATWAGLTLNPSTRMRYMR